MTALTASFIIRGLVTSTVFCCTRSCGTNLITSMWSQPAHRQRNIHSLRRDSVLMCKCRNFLHDRRNRDIQSLRRYSQLAHRLLANSCCSPAFLSACLFCSWTDVLARFAGAIGIKLFRTVQTGFRDLSLPS